MYVITVGDGKPGEDEIEHAYYRGSDANIAAETFQHYIAATIHGYDGVQVGAPVRVYINGELVQDFEAARDMKLAGVVNGDTTEQIYAKLKAKAQRERKQREKREQDDVEQRVEQHVEQHEQASIDDNADVGTNADANVANHSSFQPVRQRVRRRRRLGKGSARNLVRTRTRRRGG